MYRVCSFAFAFFTSLAPLSGALAQTPSVQIDAKEEAALAELPAGVILMWNRGVVPEGWALCDGTMGTPDLVDRFVKGTKSKVSIGQITEASGSAKVVAATAVGQGNPDVWHIDTESAERQNEPTVTGRNHTHEVFGSAAIEAVEPKSTALVFIMRCAESSDPIKRCKRRILSD